MMPTMTPTITAFQPAAQQLANSAALADGLVARGLDLSTPQAVDSVQRYLQGIPIYPDLVDRLVNTTKHPDPDIAYMLAVCSAYSYSSVETLSEIMSLLGFSQNRCQIFSRVVDGMLIDSAAFLVQGRDRHNRKAAVLVYRGTSPLNFNHWLIDIDVAAEKIESPGFPGGSVHAGFHRNIRATQRVVIEALRNALRDEPFDVLYITGHSLGAAMAALMAATLASNSEYREIFRRVRAVYTFAQPMVGDSDFAEACQSDDFLRNNVFRFIYGHDIVPHLPPTVSGDYRHFGREFRYQVRECQHKVSMLRSEVKLGLHFPLMFGFEFPFVYRPARLWTRTRHWRDTSQHPVCQVLGIYDIANSFLDFFARKLMLAQYVPIRYSIEDHLPRHYVHAVAEAASVQISEFGQ